MRVSVRKETPLYNKLQDFLRNDENKTELFIMIADALIQVLCQKTIIATTQEEPMPNGFDSNLKICPAIRKKQIWGYSFMYLILVRKNLKKLVVSIVTIDRDVVVIALYHYPPLQIDELCVEFGVGEHKRWLLIH